MLLQLRRKILAHEVTINLTRDIVSRDRLLLLLRESGFEIADFAIGGRARAQMEIYAVRKS